MNRENLFKTSVLRHFNWLLPKYLRSALQEVRPERALLAVHTRVVPVACALCGRRTLKLEEHASFKVG